VVYIEIATLLPTQPEQFGETNESIEEVPLWIDDL
jgi:hypothetical protein